MTTDEEYAKLYEKYGRLDYAFEKAFTKFKKEIGHVKTAFDLGYRAGHIQAKKEERQRVLEEVKKEWNILLEKTDHLHDLECGRCSIDRDVKKFDSFLNGGKNGN